MLTCLDAGLFIEHTDARAIQMGNNVADRVLDCDSVQPDIKRDDLPF